MSFGLLFSGQGTQHAQMLPWVGHDDALVRQTEAALGVTDWRLALQDPAWAARNRNVQILLTGIGLSAWARISPLLPVPAAVAGYSVGELAAFSAAGAFDAGTAIELAEQRADAMDRCAAGSPGALLAVTGLAAPTVEALCADTGVSVAIRIDADAVVLGGPKQAVNVIEQLARGQGAKCSVLNVEVASHTPAMRPAADDFARVLLATALKSPPIPLFSNAAGDRVRGADQAVRALSLQIAQTVQWADCMDAIYARRVACVLELGPGSALAAMWNRRHPDVPARSADEFRRATSVVDWVLGKI
jgi:[acyl-carrier-protein] S-malonyltransferase